MSQYLISVCVHTKSGEDRDRVAQTVAGHGGRLRPMTEPRRFWARTALTLRQVRAIEGVKECHLAPGTW